ncbi:MAG: hypothetical protein IJR07_03975 [Bacteroidaceae bacterium]|nr:hypothetical protein [Bacteroidaceae bacterium]
MDGLIDFLFFAGFIAVCIFFDKINKVVKNAQKEQEGPKPVIVNIPTQQPRQPAQVKKPAKKVRKSEPVTSWRQTGDMSQRAEFKNEGVRSTANIVQPIEVQPRSEYAIDSAEDARKAIIWSEILKRKY